MDSKENIHKDVTEIKKEILAIDEIKRGADLFVLLFKWQQETLERNGNFDVFDEAS